MPFKTDKISYGFPHQEYPQAAVVERLQTLTETIHLGYEPVGITFLYDEAEYDAYPADESDSSIPYCVMVKRAATAGVARKTLLKHHACDGGTTALGLEPSTPEIDSGRTYFSYNLYSSVSTAHRHLSGIKRLCDGPFLVHGVAVVPLSQCTQTPDVIIMVVSPYQAMRLVQGYAYHTGKKPDIDLGAMQAMCSEVTASPYITGEMNVSVMCPSTRMLCKWDESEMLVGIPYELFDLVASGVEATVMEY
ncbi:MAG: DUF169 domain-containing protein [Atopobiaceae bacterium]|nr:DUF169 domain-containing protein [Atopobiaceae bacterium]